MPVPTISPSPWQAWPSPRKNSAPGAETGKVDGDARAEAAVVHVAAEGAAGRRRDRLAVRPAPRRSSRSSARAPPTSRRGPAAARRGGRCRPCRRCPRTRASVRAATRPRLDRRRSARPPRRSSRCRGWASSGRSAPEAYRPARRPRRRTGRSSGWARRRRFSPAASKPHASRVVVITVSPSAMRSTGSYGPDGVVEAGRVEAVKGQESQPRCERRNSTGSTGRSSSSRRGSRRGSCR